MNASITRESYRNEIGLDGKILFSIFSKQELDLMR